MKIVSKRHANNHRVGYKGKVVMDEGTANCPYIPIVSHGTVHEGASCAKTAWTFEAEADLQEKLIAVGINPRFLTADPMPQTPEEVYQELLELLEDMPE